MSAIIQEYTYEDETHLNGDEALEKYKKEKALHPDALVVLDDLDCGHWDVDVYKTEDEKEAYLRKRVSRILEQFSNALRKWK